MVYTGGMAKRRNVPERKRPGIDRRPPPPWERYDPRWLVWLAREQHPERPELQLASAQCTTARPFSCCAQKTCGYYFVDPSQPNQPGSEWQFKESVALWREDGVSVILDVLKDGRVGAIEFV